MTLRNTVGSMNASFSQTGGARLGFFNATFPFATLSADGNALKLSCFGSDYDFPKSKIQKLSRYRGIFSVGLRIEHNDDSFPKFVVFWASVFFWTRRFQILKRQLEALGYAVLD